MALKSQMKCFSLILFYFFFQTFKTDGVTVDETVTFDSSCEITGSVAKTKAS